MALTKIGKEGITGISNASDATFLTATSGEGVTLAGTLAVTGIHTVGTNAVATSDGGAATTSIVQGLAKARVRYNQDTSTKIDSFNVDGYTDSVAGKSIIVFTSPMNNATYNAITDGTDTDVGSAYDQTHSEAFTSSQFQVSHGVYSTGAVTTDFVLGQAVVHGDLA